MKRRGEMVMIRPEGLEDYKKYLANPFTEVNDMIKACNIQNYSIFQHVIICLHIMSITGEDLKLTWQKWRRILLHRNGGT